MFRCKVCGALIGSYPCPVCKATPSRNPLTRLNPPPSAVPSGKHKYSKYCPVCDMHIVRKFDFERCPYCGEKVHG